jgi:beta-glucosidase-like glycosyl hydrolase
MDAWVAGLEDMDEDARRAALAYVAGQAVEIPEDELNEAVRRALVVRAVGGSPQRELSLAEEAVVRLAEELDGAERRLALEQRLESLRLHVREQPAAASSLDQLLADSDLAWRCFAAAHVATELG